MRLHTQKTLFVLNSVPFSGQTLDAELERKACADRGVPFHPSETEWHWLSANSRGDYDRLITLRLYSGVRNVTKGEFGNDWYNFV